MNIVASLSPKSYDIPAVSGWYLNNQWLSIPIRPDEDSELIPEFKLQINNMNYNLDSYITSSGTTIGSGTNGFSLDFNYNPSYIRIRWNYIIQNDGFNITSNDDVVLYYYTE